MQVALAWGFGVTLAIYLTRISLRVHEKSRRPLRLRVDKP